MNDRFALSALVALALAPAIARAQDDAQTIGPQRVVALAAETSPTLQAAMLQRERAMTLVLGEEARYGFVFGADGSLNVGETPSLSRDPTTMQGLIVPSYVEQATLGVELNRSFEWGMNIELRVAGGRQFSRRVFIPGTPAIAVGPGYTFDGTLTITQSLLRNGWDTNGLASLRQARVESDRATAARDRAASEIVRDALGGYWELWYAQHALDVEIATRALAESQLAEARARQELGSLARADVLSFATRVATAEEAVAAAEGSVQQRQLELARIVGGRSRRPLVPSDAPPEVPGQRDAAILDIVIERSPELAELTAQVRAAEEQARTAGNALDPRLDVQAQLGVHGMGYDDVGAAFSQFGSFAAVTGLVSLVFEMPLDDAQHRAQIQSANLATDIAIRQLEAARDRVRTEAARLLDASRVARRRLALADETVRIAGESATAEQQRYELGSSTPTAVLEAQSQLRNAQLRQLRATIDLVVSDIQLAHVAGELLDDALGE